MGSLSPINPSKGSESSSEREGESESEFSRRQQCHSLPPATATPSTSRDFVRTSPGRRVALRHPTPDLQVLQGAYTSNIRLLEEAAERLSTTSSIEDAIKQLHDEQKRSDSRRSSLLSLKCLGAISPPVSNASSIVEVSSLARSGGYSPAGYVMSPIGSFTAGTRARSASKSSRFGSRPEPEMEGRPLDSFVNMSFSNFSLPPPFPDLHRTTSIDEQDEHSSTLTRPVVDKLASPNMAEILPKRSDEADRPATSASMNTVEQAKIWDDFDGIHGAPMHDRRTLSGEFSNPDTTLISRPRAMSGNVDGLDQNTQRRRSSVIGSVHSDDNAQGRVSSGNRLSMASLSSPQSYADPDSGQQMVYYPAPVPMMLNLPPKLSKAPSSMARNMRRSQVLSSIPAAARQSAIWLPDVLENEEDKVLAVDDESQQQEYLAQHQRVSMGGRRLPQDLSHMPPQLRASTFFDLPGSDGVTEVKHKSAVAALDSILDASAHAPVSAFTDHAFAGHLGPEVYGRTSLRNNRNSSQLLEMQKKRTSSFNILRGKRSSSNDLLASEKRAATMSGVVESAERMPLDDDDDEDNTKDTTPLNQSDIGDSRSRGVSGDFDLEGKDGDDEESDDGQRDDEVYYGAPTTLLAELQLRKQQQKQRTRPLAKSYPNGMHSTLLEMDAVAQVEQRARKGKRINLAWEDPTVQAQEDGEGDDEDVPLAMLYAKKSHIRDLTRPMGLMEQRDLEDNEPLSQRRNRLRGRPPGGRAATMMNLSGPAPPEDEGETLQERARRLKEGGNANGLPTARPISGDFASEMMSQLGGDVLNPKGKGKGKEVSPSPEEEETLGQRRKRLHAEREARTKEVGVLGEAQTQRPDLKTPRSMADILQAHPSAGADRLLNYQKPATGLLGMHEKSTARRSSTMLNLNSSNLLGPQAQRAPSGGFKGGQFNDGQGGTIPPPRLQQQAPYNMYGGNGLFPQPSLGNFNAFNPNGFNNGLNNGFNNQMMMPFASPYPMQMGMGMGYNPNTMPMNMAMGMPMGQGLDALNQNQLDMVERWRQSVMQ